MMQIPDIERWSRMSLREQMANIGSEVGRSAKWISKDKPQMAEGAFLRALDLIDLTIKTSRSGLDSRPALLKELCRCRELYCGAYLSCDIDNLNYLDRYFGQFAKALRR